MNLAEFSFLIPILRRSGAEICCCRTIWLHVQMERLLRTVTLLFHAVLLAPFWSIRTRTTSGSVQRGPATDAVHRRTIAREELKRERLYVG